MNDPYKLPLPSIPHKTMAVHGTPRSAGLHRHYEFAATAAVAAAWQQLGGSLAAAEAEVRRRRRR